MSSSSLYRLAGLAAILAGIAYFLDTAVDYLLPNNVLGIGIFVSLFGLHGLTGAFLYQREVGGRLNVIGYAVNFTGLAALIGLGLYQQFYSAEFRNGRYPRTLFRPIVTHLHYRWCNLFAGGALV